jgi:hypothetical protein
MHEPDNWVVVKFPDHYRVLAGWSGGYLSGDSWRLNSGIVRAEQDGQYWYFYGASGSYYSCRKGAYCLRKNNSYIYEQLQQKYEVSIMDEGTDWSKVEWGTQ